MPVVITETAKSVNGQVTEQKQRVDITCENGGCTRGLKRGPAIISFDPADADNLPKDVWSVLYVVDYKGNRYSFCSKFCLKEFLTSYKPLQPPGNVVHFPDSGIVE